MKKTMIFTGLLILINHSTLYAQTSKFGIGLDAGLSSLISADGVYGEGYDPGSSFSISVHYKHSPKTHFVFMAAYSAWNSQAEVYESYNNFYYGSVKTELTVLELIPALRIHRYTGSNKFNYHLQTGLGLFLYDENLKYSPSENFDTRCACPAFGIRPELILGIGSDYEISESLNIELTSIYRLSFAAGGDLENGFISLDLGIVYNI